MAVGRKWKDKAPGGRLLFWLSFGRPEGRSRPFHPPTSSFALPGLQNYARTKVEPYVGARYTCCLGEAFPFWHAPAPADGDDAIRSHFRREPRANAAYPDHAEQTWVAVEVRKEQRIP